ncbi:hypothetical protein PILCRDRAFT_811701 [Piloderma croceum F 1598]|uniref:Uncharacterized protein n=1 Tax=Piloderma croceum (strain F 1598) TaxID=765440 RepID=A0A0C3GHQ8_PILCF|nr:hypothetical protein PILCRDRAFT_811701 [Piloderma croceum F 1598]
MTSAGIRRLDIACFESEYTKLDQIYYELAERGTKEHGNTTAPKLRAVFTAVIRRSNRLATIVMKGCTSAPSFLYGGSGIGILRRKDSSSKYVSQRRYMAYYRDYCASLVKAQG